LLIIEENQREMRCMSDEWYYTQYGQQQGPVTTAELKSLAASGRLLPTDLVWREGMSTWAPAETTRGLFSQDLLAAGPAPLIPRLTPAVTEDCEVSSQSEERGIYDDEARPQRRRKSQSNLSPAALVAITGGVLGLLLLVGGIVLAIVLFGGQGDSRSWSLQKGQKVTYNLRFTGGKKVELWVTSERDTDVDLFVFDSKRQRVAVDEGDSKDCYVTFVPTTTQSYQVEVQNRVRLEPFLQHRNGPNSGVLRFKESDAAAVVQGPGGAAPPAPMLPQPAGGGGASWSVDLAEGFNQSRLVAFQAGRPVDVTVISEQASDVDLYVFDMQNHQVAADVTVGPNSFVRFVPGLTGSYRLEVRNLGPGPNRSHVRWSQ
jgi:hypothetical protein